ncbi:hypothetical protein BJY01DRAFT_248631 [Aspergillus pseudoustus]|uniref:NAD-dependent epimerase/dehydratase domain-containing protein n=1 Tax=Aspergillus pseudoustus TaxID=1810923 RepID=A0ABR4JWP8_9EURO
MECDITDAGQVSSAFHTKIQHSEPLSANATSRRHRPFCGHSTTTPCSRQQTFIANITGFHNVIEAACKLGIKKIVLASSVAVYSPDEYASFDKYVHHPDDWAIHGWSYVDARDLGRICHQCLKVDGLGWQVFNAANNSITNRHHTTEYLRSRYPHIPFTRELETTEAPMSNRKIRTRLGFEEDHPWQRYFSDRKTE